METEPVPESSTQAPDPEPTPAPAPTPAPEPTPHYSTLQNVGWMIDTAWHIQKWAAINVLLMATLTILLNLTQLYIAPMILAQVEAGATVPALLKTVALFTLALFLLEGFKEYVETNTIFPRVDVRLDLIAQINRKAITSSYVNTLDPNFNKLREKAFTICESNNKPAEHIWTTMTLLLQNLGGLIVYLTILRHMDPVLLLVVAATSIASFFASVHAANWHYAHRDEEEAYYQKKHYLRSQAESIEFAKDIRIFGLQPWLQTLLDQIHDLYLDWRLRAERVSFFADFIAALLTMARNGLAYAYLIRLTLHEGLPVSEFLLYFTAVSTFTDWVMGVLQSLSTLHKESLDLSRLREFLDYPEPFRWEGGLPLPQPGHGYSLTLDHVSYRYPGASHDTLHDLNLTVHAGEKLALVGLNGAGKTTLVKLLCGLLDPTEGHVLLNGQDIRAFNRGEYYNLFSAVFQDFSILDVTIAENIAQTREGIDQDKMADCLDKAGLTDFVASLPQGLDTHVGREVYLDGILFSGGQTQRLILARALYKDGPILILDEPTAALDPLAENDIYQKYNDMTRGKTSVFISHRLASTRFCDRILLLDQGQIREEGTHASLLAQGGAYADLFAIQSRYYQEGKDY